MEATVYTRLINVSYTIFEYHFFEILLMQFFVAAAGNKSFFVASGQHNRPIEYEYMCTI